MRVRIAREMLSKSVRMVYINKGVGVYCGNCGIDNLPGKYCHECGGVLSEKNPECLKCGNPDASGNYCNLCGHNLHSYNCSKCGAPNQVGRFCGKCGVSLVETNQPEGKQNSQVGNASCQMCYSKFNGWDELGLPHKECPMCAASEKYIVWAKN